MSDGLVKLVFLLFSLLLIGGGSWYIADKNLKDAKKEFVELVEDHNDKLRQEENNRYSLITQELGVDRDLIILTSKGDSSTVYSASTDQGEYVFEFNEDYTEIVKSVSLGK